MDGLRLILIIAGIIILALVYFFSRRANQDQKSPDEKSVQKDTEWMEEIARQRRKLAETRDRQPVDDFPSDIPALDDLLKNTPNKTAAPETGSTTQAGSTPPAETGFTEKERGSQQPEKMPESVQPPPPPPEELIVALHIFAPQDMVFVGANLFSALEEVGLRFGEGGIFHYHHSRQDGENRDTVLFSVANILEPGTFSGGQLKQEFTTPGVVMFMRAPGAIPAREMVKTLLLKAQQLAQLLGGEIRDEARNPINETALQSLLDRATAFDNRNPNRPLA